MKVITSIVLSFTMLVSCGIKEQSHLTDALVVELSTQYPFEYYDLEGTAFTSEEETTALIEETLVEIADTLNMP